MWTARQTTRFRSKMTGQTVILRGPPQRLLAHKMVDTALTDYVVTVRPPKRSLDQNARMWAMLADIAKQCELDGRKFIREDWKCIFMRACGWDVMFLPGLSDGRPFPAGFKSSKMTVRQMADLITFIIAYGDERGVEWSEPHPDERGTG